MFLSTMTYEEIYQAISDEMPDVFAHYHKVEKPKIDRALKKATHFPRRITIDWKHPKSRNTYTYYIQSNRPAQWSNPFMSVFCSRDVRKGKELFVIVPNLYKKELFLNIFTQHFYEQYAARFLKEDKDYYRIVATYLMRNTKAASMGKELVSINEQQTEVSGFKKESMLTIDGLGLGIRSNNGTIVIYRTFVSFDLLFDNQYQKIWPIYLYFVCSLAIETSPKEGVLINSIYEEGAAKMHQLSENENLSDKEKVKLIYQEYEQTYMKLVKYIK